MERMLAHLLRCQGEQVEEERMANRAHSLIVAASFVRPRGQPQSLVELPALTKGAIAVKDQTRADGRNQLPPQGTEARPVCWRHYNIFLHQRGGRRHRADPLEHTHTEHI